MVTNEKKITLITVAKNFSYLKIVVAAVLNLFQRIAKSQTENFSFALHEETRLLREESRKKLWPAYKFHAF